MGWSAQYFTTIIIEGNTPQTGLFIYSGVPQNGNLIGSWAAQAGTDAFGNTYPAGINVFQGQLTGVAINNPTITAGSLLASALTNCVSTGEQFTNGVITQSTFIMNTSGGVILGYTTTTTTVTLSQGTVSWAGAINGTASVSCWGSGASGSGGISTEGGETGGGGEWANEPAYPITTSNTYSISIPLGGQSVQTGNSGNPGDSCIFDTGQLSGGSVVANGGTNGANFIGGKGGSGSTNTNHFNGGNGASGVSGNTGGASGGNSGCPTANGNSGSSSSGATGASAPAAQTGAGRGGAGGSNGANGSAGAVPGGAGGGAGAGNTPTVVTETFKCNATWSYYASQGLRNTNGTCYHGYYGDPNNWEYFYWTFGQSNLAHNLNAVLSATYGTINWVKLTLKNQHSWYNNGMRWGLHSSTTLGGGIGVFSNILNPGGTFISEGATTTYNLSSGEWSPFAAGGFTYWVLSPDSGDTTNLAWYGYFSGVNSIELQVNYTTAGSGATNSGAGGNAQIAVTYSSTSALDCAMSPTAASDSAGNAFAAGYTGQINAFQPNSSPTTVEVWHKATLSGSVSVNSGNNVNGFWYRYTADNCVEMVWDVTFVAAGTLFTLPSGYTPATQQTWPTGWYGTGPAAYSSSFLPRLQCSTGGAITWQGNPVTTADYCGYYKMPLATL